MKIGVNPRQHQMEHLLALVTAKVMVHLVALLILLVHRNQQVHHTVAVLEAMLENLPEILMDKM